MRVLNDALVPLQPEQLDVLDASQTWISRLAVAGTLSMRLPLGENEILWMPPNRVSPLNLKGQTDSLDSISTV